MSHTSITSCLRSIQVCNAHVEAFDCMSPGYQTLNNWLPWSLSTVKTEKNMSAVEVPPCSLENENNPLEINVEIIHRVPPVIFDRKQCQEFEIVSFELKKYKENDAGSENGKTDEECTNEKQDGNSRITEDNKSDCGLPVECKYLPNDQNDSQIMIEDSSELSNKGKISELLEQCVIKSEHEQIGEDRTNGVFNDVDNTNDTTLANDIGCDSTDQLDQSLDAHLDNVTEYINDSLGQQTKNKCLEDKTPHELGSCDLENFINKDIILGNSSLTTSQEEEMERLKVLDSLRAEYINKVWDDYVSDFLIASGHVTQAAILDSETGLFLAGSDGFKIHENEFRHLLLGIQYQEAAYRYGVTLNGHHYNVRLADGRHGIFAKSETGGCSVCKTNTLLIIGVHDKLCNPRRCNEEVMRLGDFFNQKGM